MKSKFSYFLIIFVLMGCLIGCTSTRQEKYTSLNYDATNDGISPRGDVDYWLGETNVKKFKLTKTLELFGNKYTAEYLHSTCDRFMSFETDLYRDSYGREFGINKKGDLVYVNLQTYDYRSDEPLLEDLSNPYENAIDRSYEIADEMIDDISEYVREVKEKVLEYDVNGLKYEITNYYVTYTRKFNEYMTSDYISLVINSKGNVLSIRCGDVGSFNKLDIDFDIEKVNESVLDKINADYQSIGYKVLSSNIHNEKIVITPNGEICMYSNVELEVSNIETGEKADTSSSILTVVGYT